MKQLVIVVFIFTQIALSQETPDNFGIRLFNWVILDKAEKIIDENTVVFGEKDAINLIRTIKQQNISFPKNEEKRFLADVKKDRNVVISSVCTNFQNKEINPKEIKYLFVKNVSENKNKRTKFMKFINGSLYFSYKKKIFKMDFEAIKYDEFYKLHNSHNIWEVNI